MLIAQFSYLKTTKALSIQVHIHKQCKRIYTVVQLCNKHAVVSCSGALHLQTCKTHDDTEIPFRPPSAAWWCWWCGALWSRLPPLQVCAGLQYYSVSSFLRVLLYLNVIRLSSQNRLFPPWTLCWEIKKKKRPPSSRPFTNSAAYHGNVSPFAGEYASGLVNTLVCLNGPTDITLCFCGLIDQSPPRTCAASAGESESATTWTAPRVSVGFFGFLNGRIVSG